MMRTGKNVNMYHHQQTIMSITDRLSINLTPIRLQSVSSLRSLHSVNDFTKFFFTFKKNNAFKFIFGF